MREGRGAGEKTTSGLRFSVLGPLGVRFDGELLNLGGAKQQMVLARLLLEPGMVVPVERLTDWVWPDADDPARHAATLQVYISNLRRVLAPIVDHRGEPVISTRRPGYQIDVGHDELDLLEFREEALLGRQALTEGRPAVGADHLRAALDLWRGEPLAGLPVDATRAGLLTRLEAEKTAVLEALAGAELATGRHREVLADLRSWAEAHPTHEELHRHLMVALYRCGRQADALACFQDLRRRLVEEFGIEPSRDLRELEGHILDQHPSLDLESSAGDLLEMSTTALRSSLIAPHASLSIDGATIALKPTVTTIGRLPDSDVVVDESSVSRRHAEIRRTGDVHRIVDVGSANGTVVNGVRVLDQLLVDGDLIRLGGKDIRFNCPPPLE